MRINLCDLNTIRYVHSHTLYNSPNYILKKAREGLNAHKSVCIQHSTQCFFTHTVRDLAKSQSENLRAQMNACDLNKESEPTSPTLHCV